MLLFLRKAGHYFNIHTPAFEKWPIPLKVAAPTFKYRYPSDAYIFQILECNINLTKTLNIFKLKQLTLTDDRVYHVTI